jgi:hypothetical protein
MWRRLAKWKRETKQKVRWALWPRSRIEDVATTIMTAVPIERPQRKLSFDNAPNVTSPRATRAIENRVVRHVKTPALLEPLAGYLIVNGRLVERSHDSFLERQPSQMTVRRAKRKRVPVAVSLHHLYPDNYYHFLTIVAPRLPLFDAARIPKSIPVVVPLALTQRRFFQDACLPGATLSCRRPMR